MAVHSSLSASEDGGVRTTKNVVISGAGPAGILCALHLLRRNNLTNSRVHYKVTLVDAGPDYGKMNPDKELRKYRSWMIGMAFHGLTALREIPGLYEDYVSHIGVKITGFALHLGAKEIKASSGGDGDKDEAYLVDRNFIVASLARYLNDFHGSDKWLTTRFETKVLLVDEDNHKVLLRPNVGSEAYFDYDLLIGADGVRSRAREAIARGQRDFEYDVGDIFQYFKAVHVKCPEGVDHACMHALPSCFPAMQGIGLPETEGKINISMGVARNNFAMVPSELKSDDPAVVASYVKANFKAFELEDYDDFAQQWVKQKKWNQTGQVHCNFYHSLPARVIIMGDAAHATSPSIGMGMNTAFADASAFARLLDKHEDDFEVVLPAFSEERVKEGNALTDLAMHLNCLDDRAQFIETIRMVTRSALHNKFPCCVMPHPQQMLGRGEQLSEVYNHSVNLGIMTKHRRINDKIRRETFDSHTGMVQPRKQRGTGAVATRCCCTQQ